MAHWLHVGRQKKRLCSHKIVNFEFFTFLLLPWCFVTDHWLRAPWALICCVPHRCPPRPVTFTVLLARYIWERDTRTMNTEKNDEMDFSTVLSTIESINARNRPEGVSAAYAASKQETKVFRWSQKSVRASQQHGRPRSLWWESKWHI